MVRDGQVVFGDIHISVTDASVLPLHPKATAFANHRDPVPIPLAFSKD